MMRIEEDIYQILCKKIDVIESMEKELKMNSKTKTTLRQVKDEGDISRIEQDFCACPSQIIYSNSQLQD